MGLVGEGEHKLGVLFFIHLLQFEVLQRVVFGGDELLPGTGGGHVDCLFGEGERNEVFYDVGTARLHLQFYYTAIATSLITYYMNESSESSGGFLSQTPPESSHLTEKMQEIAGEVENIKQTLSEFYADRNYEEIVADKCAVPPELFQKRDGIAEQMQRLENRQIQLSDQIDNEHHKIALLKAQIAANRESSSILANLDKRQQIQTKQKDLAQLFNQHAQKQSDTILIINAGPLEEQVALKQKNEEAMIEVLMRKIEKEKLKIKNIQKERENTEKKTKMLIRDRVIEQQKIKKEKDEQLVMHFIKNFEQGIKKMETIIRNNSSQ